jgi:mono/diheme cytochrome c family protein
LVEHVVVCVDCHSERDYSRYSAPVRAGTFGQGGERFGHEIGIPGELVAPNITPAGIASWSDGELARAITSGVSADGHALFPLMNYPSYASMCERDLHAVLGYVRSLPAIQHAPPRSSLDFPVNWIVRTLPAPATTPKRCPDESDSVARGKYLVTQASCAECHTRHEGGAPVVGQEFAGGARFPLPSGYVARSANITPDRETGIGNWSKEMFVQRFAAFRDPAAQHPVRAQEPNTPMPWSMFAGMTDADLGAIYDYLRTLPAVKTDGLSTMATR